MAEKALPVNFDTLRAALATETNESVRNALKLVLAAGNNEENGMSAFFI